MSIPNQHRLKLILLFCFVSRMLFWLFIVDHNDERYAEYGIIARYMSEGKGYSCFSKTSDDYSYRYQCQATVQPSALMMPGYTLFVYSGFLLDSPALRSFYFCFTQILAAVGVCLILYYLSLHCFGQRVALWSAAIYALLPEMIVSANTVSSTVFVQLCVLILVLVLNRQFANKSWQVLSICVTSALLLSMRAEALLFLGVVVAYQLWKKRYSAASSIVVGCLLFLVPWIARNASVFHEFVPLTTSGGMNLYRGHNPYSVGVWSDDSLRARIRALPFNEHIELSVDSLHRAEALRTIREQPMRELGLSAQKLLNFITIDTSDSRSMHLAYLVPSCLLILLLIIGLQRQLNQRIGIQPELWIYIICSCITVVIFFPLPRYQSMMRVGIIPIVALAADYATALLLSRLGPRVR